MPQVSYPLFENEDYTFTSTATSRAFYAWMNFESPLVQDPTVRRAIAMGIDKEGFVTTLLAGNGEPAAGAFPASFPFGGDRVTAEPYDPEGAKQVLEDAGWVDSDGDGVRERDGQRLELRWLTYPSRQELPLLAESAQATLGEIGIAVSIQSTADHNSIRTDPTAGGGGRGDGLRLRRGGAGPAGGGDAADRAGRQRLCVLRLSAHEHDRQSRRHRTAGPPLRLLRDHRRAGHPMTRRNRPWERC